MARQVNVAAEARKVSIHEVVRQRPCSAPACVWRDAPWGPSISARRFQSPPAWKTEGPWREAAPKDAIPKGAWWEIFHDDELNHYEQQLLAANQSLAAARRSPGSGSFAGASRFCRAYSQRSAPIPTRRATDTPANRPEVTGPAPALRRACMRFHLLLNYEVDLFGRIRKNLEAANATLQGTRGRLAERSTGLDRGASRRLLQPARTGCRNGSGAGVGQNSAGRHGVWSTIVMKAGLPRDWTWHSSKRCSIPRSRNSICCSSSALNTSTPSRRLPGNPASSFNVPVAPLRAAPPPVPLGVPSDLLERRPDIATAERAMANENALVGVAEPRFIRNSLFPAAAAFRASVWVR